jgi:hypothetical protein
MSRASNISLSPLVGFGGMTSDTQCTLEMASLFLALAGSPACNMLAFTLATTALVAFTSARSTAPHARLIRQRRGQGYGLTQDLTGQALLDFFRFEERVDASARYVGQDEGKQLGLVRINGDNSVTLR